MNIPELEVLAFVVAALKAANITGINPSTGNSRTVAIFNQVKQDAFVPYLRCTLTDTLNLDTEPYSYSFVPTAKTIHVMVDSFSDYEPESFSLAAQIQAALQHQEITTTNYHGSTWLTASDYFVDNITNPDRIVRRASIRIEARVEPL